MKKINIDGEYYVTENGDIINKTTGRTLKQTIGSTGYYGVVVKPYGKHGKTILIKTHRVIALAFVDGYFEGAVVNHKDGNKLNNDIINLEWVTQKENTIHAVENGFHTPKHGYEHGSCVVNTSMVSEILSSSLTQRELAIKFGVSKSTVQAIKAGTRRYTETK